MTIQFPVRFFAVTFATVCLTALPAAAQTGNTGAPPPPPPSSAPKPSLRETQLKEFRDLQKSLADVEKQKPAEAIERYKKFWEEKSDMVPQVGILVISYVSKIQQQNLKNVEEAVATCDFGIKTYKMHHDRVELVLRKADIMMAALRTDEAAKVVEDNWTLGIISTPYYTSRLMATYQAAMKQQAKEAQYIDTLRKTFSSYGPIVLCDESWSGSNAILTALIEALAAKNQRAEALSWAKLRFKIGPYSEPGLTRAYTSLALLNTPVTSAAPAKGAKPSPGKAPKRVFGQTPAANEGATEKALDHDTLDKWAVGLKEVALPEAAKQQNKLEARLTEIKETKGEAAQIERIALHLLLSNNRAAMDEALRYREAMPKSAVPTQQIARVFKAADGNLKRADAFVAGPAAKSDALLADFLAQYPK
jgi:hypothetical protein